MDDKGVWSGERPDGEEGPAEEARVDWDERAVREQVVEELEVGANRFPSSSGRLVLMSLSNATNSARDLFAFSRNVWLKLCLTTSSESAR